MMGYTHFPGGVATGLLLATTLPSPNVAEIALCGVCGGLGGLFPDIDSPSSKISQMVPPIGWLVSKLCKHRGATHTLLFWLLALGIPYVLLPAFSLVFVALYAGVVSHLLLDACTPSGCRMFQPMTKKKVRFAKIRTNSRKEIVVTTLMYLCCLSLALELAQGQWTMLLEQDFLSMLTAESGG